MIFGKDKKAPFTNPLARPLESAALGRWRTLNESSKNENSGVENQELAEEDIPTEHVDGIDELSTKPFHGLEEAEDFIREQIPLISLNNPIVEAAQEEDEDIEDPGSFAHHEDYDDDSQAENYQILESVIGKSEAAVEPSRPVAPTVTTPVVAPREKTLMGDFGISVEDDIKNRFGSNLKSALGHGTVIEGMFSFENPVKIDGSLKGEIRSSSALIVGPEAQVNARIKVGTLIVLGSVQGEIEAEDLIEVRSTGCLDGDLVTRRFALEEGGIFNGACTMIE